MTKEVRKMEYRGLFEKMDELAEGLKRAEMRGIIRLLEGHKKAEFAA